MSYPDPAWKPTPADNANDVTAFAVVALAGLVHWSAMILAAALVFVWPGFRPWKGG